MMRYAILCTATAVAITCGVGSAEAQPLYSFEADLEGFAPNGGGTYSQDTIGATHGTNSMKVELVSDGDGFVGALTQSVLPPALGNPPGVKSILFDMTIASGDEFGGGFAVVGVTIFETGGIPHQFADTEPIDGKAAGTYNDIRIDLDDSGGQSFNDIFGSTTISGFQFLFNKSTAASGHELTVYIDNVRTIVPEPTTGVLLGLGAITIGMVVRRRR